MTSSVISWQFCTQSLTVGWTAWDLRVTDGYDEDRNVLGRIVQKESQITKSRSLIGVFPKQNRNSVNPMNSGNLKKQWCMNWIQFKDPVSRMCLGGNVVAVLVFNIKVGRLEPFYCNDICFFTEFRENIQSCHHIDMLPTTYIIISNPLLSNWVYAIAGVIGALTVFVLKNSTDIINTVYFLRISLFWGWHLYETLFRRQRNFLLFGVYSLYFEIHTVLNCLSAFACLSVPSTENYIHYMVLLIWAFLWEI